MLPEKRSSEPRSEMLTTDAHTIDFLISLAEISGVFVGFGVLIGAVQRMNDVTPERKALAQVVSVIGLIALLAALVPPTLREFGVSGHSLWFYSSIGYFIVIFIGIAAVIVDEDFREYGIINYKRWRFVAPIFWICLEVPLQGALFLNIFGVLPDKANAFYIFAVFLNVAEAAMALTLLVLHKENTEV
jgi:hypothetical protein